MGRRKSREEGTSDTRLLITVASFCPSFYEPGHFPGNLVVRHQTSEGRYITGSRLRKTAYGTSFASAIEENIQSYCLGCEKLVHGFTVQIQQRSHMSSEVESDFREVEQSERCTVRRTSCLLRVSFISQTPVEFGDRHFTTASAIEQVP